MVKMWKWLSAVLVMALVLSLGAVGLPHMASMASPASAQESMALNISVEEFPIEGYISSGLERACDFRWYGDGVWSEKSEYGPSEDFIDYSQFANCGDTSNYTVYFYLYEPGTNLVWSDSVTGPLLGGHYVKWTVTLGPPGDGWEAGDWHFCSDVTPVNCSPLTTKCCINKVVPGIPDIRLDKSHLDFEFSLAASSMGHSGSSEQSALSSDSSSFSSSSQVCPSCQSNDSGQIEPGVERQSAASEQSQLEAIRKAIGEKGAQWEAGITSVSGLSLEAKKRLCGAKFGLMPEDVETITPSLDLGTLPPTFDWRDKDSINWMTSVKDQNPCGTCWVFGSVGALEGAINIYNSDPNIDMDLSEQMLLSCSPYYNSTCCGGDPQGALNYTRDYGTANEACFPYQCPTYNPSPDPDEGCTNPVPCNRCSDWAEKAWKVTYAKVSPDTTDAYKAALVGYGPLVVPMRSPDDWFFYAGGIYQPVLLSWSILTAMLSTIIPWLQTYGVVSG